MAADGEVPMDILATLRARQGSKWQMHPPDVIPLTVAEMDTQAAPPIAEALHAAVDRSDFGYAMATELGEAVASFCGDRWGWDLDPQAVVTSADVGAGVVDLLRILSPPGDAIALSPPIYPPFFEWVKEVGGRVVEAPLAHDEHGWHLDLPRLEAVFASRPAAYLLCNPHNPVGYVPTPHDLEALVAMARRYEVPIISDEIHAPLVLSGATMTPLLTVPGAAEVAVSLLSASKAWNLAGLKCAVIVTASDRMAAVVEQIPPGARWRVGHLGAIAAVAAFNESRAWLDQLLVTLDHRRRELGLLLAEHLPMVSWDPPAATYLAWLDCRAIGTGTTPQERFLDRGRVAVEPGPRFGDLGGGYVRLNFATSAELLAEAVRRMGVAAGSGA